MSISIRPREVVVFFHTPQQILCFEPGTPRLSQIKGLVPPSCRCRVTLRRPLILMLDHYHISCYAGTRMAKSGHLRRQNELLSLYEAIDASDLAG